MTSPASGGGVPSGYQGRRSWGWGGLWDSVRYLGAFVRARIQRRRITRRLRSERRTLEQTREETLRDLGQVGLYLDGVEHPVLQDHRARRDELEASREELRETIAKHRQETAAEQEHAQQRIEELRAVLYAARKHRKQVQDRYDDLIESREAGETKSARAEFEVGFNEKTVREAEALLERLAARDAPVQEIRKVRVRLKKARIALEKARADLPRFLKEIEEVDAVLAGVQRKLDEAREQEQQASDALDRFVEDRDAEAWERHKEERRLEDRLVQLEQDFSNLFREAGRDILANRVEHPGLAGRYDRIVSLDARMEEIDVALMSLEADRPALDWKPIFRVGVWAVGAILLVLLVVRVVGILAG